MTEKTEKFLQPVVDRMKRAGQLLLSAATTTTTDEEDATRLKAKAEGVMLARSYLEEAVQEIPETPTLQRGPEGLHVDFGYLGTLPVVPGPDLVIGDWSV